MNICFQLYFPLFNIYLGETLETQTINFNFSNIIYSK